MRHRSGVKQLGRTHSHRKAMFANMATSLFENERIVTTKQKAKELKKISERLITRAKRNLDIPEEEVGKRLHNKRIIMKTINNRDIIRKLFDDIAPRFKGRNGGYTRIYLLGDRRAGDAAEMAMIELVERKSIEKTAPAADTEKKEKRKLFKKEKKEK
jgi:large subunit ribosomal protein L17